MRNHFYENDFDLQNSFLYERFRTQTRFKTEAQKNSEMAYWFGCFSKNDFQFSPWLKVGIVLELALYYGTPFVAKFNQVKYLFNPIILA